MSALPVASVSVSPQSLLYPGETVTLQCDISDYTDWTYLWSRNNQQLSSQTSETITISLPDQADVLESTGAELGEETQSTTPCTVTQSRYMLLKPQPVLNLQPSVSLRISPNTTQHFRSTSLSLSCEEKGNSTGWRLMRYTERGVESGCVSNWGSITGSTCTISYTYTGDSGVYWCESGSGENSNAVNITVAAGDVILESPVHPLTEGDSVTLTCKYWTTSSNIKADFYKDGTFIKNETSGEMTIPAVSKSVTAPK
ncbi:low affinity immunoglobulin gamma Fc region receptor II-a-like [Oncorhynchus keta]|uniref:low affinity immunoglobulin gamma Fc region receptor II-a-like n=1 Tax=Oncorhynchus keta TaxID=8018 RepID=UPI00227D2AE4|nr:low affinity immunoglobulin gamma Fc region receptor II-a-like [Oncorhynchus keta]